jgi:hypothetical protein
MSWQFYGLDDTARRLIIQQTRDTIKESHKMRATVGYGLERFYGEQLRLKNTPAGDFWRSTWDELVQILAQANVILPPHQNINNMAEQLWQLSHEDQQIALAVLTQLCDCLVWWTQRYKNIIN